jgi:hypothetical protein
MTSDRWTIGSDPRNFGRRPSRDPSYRVGARNPLNNTGHNEEDRG